MLNNGEQQKVEMLMETDGAAPAGPEVDDDPGRNGVTGLPGARRPQGRPAAFFDLDKTIIAKSSALAFSRSFYRGGLINRRAVLRSAYAQAVFLLGGAD